MLPELQKLKAALEQQKALMNENELHEVQLELLNELAFLDYIKEPVFEEEDFTKRDMNELEFESIVMKELGGSVSCCPCCKRPF